MTRHGQTLSLRRTVAGPPLNAGRNSGYGSSIEPRGDTAFDAPADHFQIYQTVSEGTPVSPVFASKEEMIEWMIAPIDRSSEYNRGQDWRCMQGMTRKQAEAFCEDESAVSMISSSEIGVVAGHRLPDAML